MWRLRAVVRTLVRRAVRRPGKTAPPWDGTERLRPLHTGRRGRRSPSESAATRTGRFRAPLASRARAALLAVRGSRDLSSSSRDNEGEEGAAAEGEGEKPGEEAVDEDAEADIVEESEVSNTPYVSKWMAEGQESKRHWKPRADAAVAARLAAAEDARLMGAIQAADERVMRGSKESGSKESGSKDPPKGVMSDAEMSKRMLELGVTKEVLRFIIEADGKSVRDIHGILEWNARNGGNMANDLVKMLSKAKEMDSDLGPDVLKKVVSPEILREIGMYPEKEPVTIAEEKAEKDQKDKAEAIKNLPKVYNLKAEFKEGTFARRLEMIAAMIADGSAKALAATAQGARLVGSMIHGVLTDGSYRVWVMQTYRVGSDHWIVKRRWLLMLLFLLAVAYFYYTVGYYSAEDMVHYVMENLDPDKIDLLGVRGALWWILDTVDYADVIYQGDPERAVHRILNLINSADQTEEEIQLLGFRLLQSLPVEAVQKKAVWMTCLETLRTQRNNVLLDLATAVLSKSMYYPKFHDEMIRCGVLDVVGTLALKSLDPSDPEYPLAERVKLFLNAFLFNMKDCVKYLCELPYVKERGQDGINDVEKLCFQLAVNEYRHGELVEQPGTMLNGLSMMHQLRNRNPHYAQWLSGVYARDENWEAAYYMYKKAAHIRHILDTRLKLEFKNARGQPRQDFKQSWAAYEQYKEWTMLGRFQYLANAANKPEIFKEQIHRLQQCVLKHLATRKPLSAVQRKLTAPPLYTDDGMLIDPLDTLNESERHAYESWLDKNMPVLRNPRDEYKTKYPVPNTMFPDQSIHLYSKHLVMMQLARGDLEGARKDILKWLQMPVTDSMYWLLSRVEAEAGNLEKSLEAVNRAIFYAHTMPQKHGNDRAKYGFGGGKAAMMPKLEYYAHRANVLWKLGRSEGAYIAANQAKKLWHMYYERVEMAPPTYRHQLAQRGLTNYSNVHVIMGRILEEKGYIEGALSQYRLLARGQPKTPMPHFRRGECYKKLGKDESAYGEFDKVLDLWMDDIGYAGIERARDYFERSNPGAMLALSTIAKEVEGVEEWDPDKEIITIPNLRERFFSALWPTPYIYMALDFPFWVYRIVTDEMLCWIGGFNKDWLLRDDYYPMDDRQRGRDPLEEVLLPKEKLASKMKELREMLKVSPNWPLKEPIPNAERAYQPFVLPQGVVEPVLPADHSPSELVRQFCQAVDEHGDVREVIQKLFFRNVTVSDRAWAGVLQKFSSEDTLPRKMVDAGLGHFIPNTRGERREDEWGAYTWREDFDEKESEKPGVLRTLAWRIASDVGSLAYNVVEYPPRKAMALSRRYFWRTHTAVSAMYDSTNRGIAAIQDEIAFQWESRRVSDRVEAVRSASFEDNWKSLTARVAKLPGVAKTVARDVKATAPTLLSNGIELGRGQWTRVAMFQDNTGLRVFDWGSAAARAVKNAAVSVVTSPIRAVVFMAGQVKDAFLFVYNPTIGRATNNAAEIAREVTPEIIVEEVEFDVDRISENLFERSLAAADSTVDFAAGIIGELSTTVRWIIDVFLDLTVRAIDDVASVAEDVAALDGATAAATMLTSPIRDVQEVVADALPLPTAKLSVAEAQAAYDDAQDRLKKAKTAQEDTEELLVKAIKDAKWAISRGICEEEHEQFVSQLWEKVNDKILEVAAVEEEIEDHYERMRKAKHRAIVVTTRAERLNPSSPNGTWIIRDKTWT